MLFFSVIPLLLWKEHNREVAHFNGISDVSGENLPLDFDRCLTPQGAIKPLNLLNQIVRGPGNLPEILRFGRQSFQAGQNLAAFLEKLTVLIPSFSERLAHA